MAACVGEAVSIAQSRTKLALRVERARIFRPIGKTLRLRQLGRAGCIIRQFSGAVERAVAEGPDGGVRPIALAPAGNLTITADAKEWLGGAGVPEDQEPRLSRGRRFPE